MERIETAKTSKELVKIWKEMAEDVPQLVRQPQVPEDAIKDFGLSGGRRTASRSKASAGRVADKNQLYVNLSEIDDPRFKVSAEDKALNKAFYGEAYNA